MQRSIAKMFVLTGLALYCQVDAATAQDRYCAPSQNVYGYGGNWYPTGGYSTGGNGSYSSGYRGATSEGAGFGAYRTNYGMAPSSGSYTAGQSFYYGGPRNTANYGDISYPGYSYDSLPTFGNNYPGAYSVFTTGFSAGFPSSAGSF